jgi:hypothetical protein
VASRLAWDINADPEVLLRVLEGGEAEGTSIDRSRLFRRLLMGCDWYMVLQLVPESLYRELLSDWVLGGVHPPSLRRKYQYAREMLFKGSG